MARHKSKHSGCSSPVAGGPSAADSLFVSRRKACSMQGVHKTSLCFSHRRNVCESKQSILINAASKNGPAGSGAPLARLLTTGTTSEAITIILLSISYENHCFHLKHNRHPLLLAPEICSQRLLLTSCASPISCCDTADLVHSITAACQSAPQQQYQER